MVTKKMVTKKMVTKAQLELQVESLKAKLKERGRATSIDNHNDLSNRSEHNVLSLESTAYEMNMTETDLVEFLLERDYIYRDESMSDSCENKYKPTERSILHELIQFGTSGSCNYRNQCSTTLRGRAIFGYLLKEIEDQK